MAALIPKSENDVRIWYKPIHPNPICLHVGAVSPVLTDDIFRKYGEDLRRRKFNFPEDSVSELLEEIKKRSILVNPAVSDLELPDDKDRPFLDALLSEDDAILVTGNLKHFPQHEQIMTARSFIAMHGEH